MSGLVPTCRDTVIFERPSLVLALEIKSIPGVPLICVSNGVVTVCSTVCASAPVNVPVTLIVGGEISGYWLIGKLKIANTPINKMTSDVTIAVTGLRIKLSAIIGLYSFFLIFKT